MRLEPTINDWKSLILPDKFHIYIPQEHFPILLLCYDFLDLVFFSLYNTPNKPLFSSHLYSILFLFSHYT